jgi:hypothetical protein
VQLSRPSARAALLAAATALVALSVAASSASAASFSGGTIKIDFKGLKGAKQTNKGTTAKNTFTFPENAGTLTMTKQASGSLKVGATTNSVTLTRGGKKLVLQSFVEKLSSGKGQLTAKINGKGKAIAFFDQASTNRVNPDSEFTTLSMSSAKMTLTKAGAAALNKAFALKGKAVYKAKEAAGTSSFTANRSLTVTGGNTTTLYNKEFIDALKGCGLTLNTIAPAQSIEVSQTAPAGGVIFPVNATAGGTINAKTFSGQVNHAGGNQLDRDASHPRGDYHSPLLNYVFGLGPVQPYTLTIFVQLSNNNLPAGEVTGTLARNLTDTGGSISLTGGTIKLSDAARGALAQKRDPNIQGPQLGADCTELPSPAFIGTAEGAWQVE